MTTEATTGTMTVTGSITRPPTRMHALDGLRGLAAVAVVIWHALISTDLGRYISIQLDTTTATTAESAAPFSSAWWLWDTPLRLASMGTNAVTIFFVLSGFVLVLPLLRGRSMNLWSYYPRRFLRLWIPSAASVLLAAALVVITLGVPRGGESAWVRASTIDRLSIGDVISNLFLITGRTSLNNPLWSLRWELLFSLLLPLAFLLVLRMKGHCSLWGTVLLSAALSGLGGWFLVPALQFGPMFVAGAAVAKLYRTRIVKPAPWRSWVATGTGLIMVSVPDAARTFGGLDLTDRLSLALSASVVIGAALLVFGLSVPSRLTTLVGVPPLRFLGRISFGLYLVHVPIIVAGALLFPDATAALWLTLPTSFIVAWLFTIWVDEPATRLAHRVGTAAAAAVAAAPPRT
ncbi:acyltransferase family protein [Microbacterium sp. ZW T5_56]|uniref:acyltransferase family protein n=1 Tax=Microbacterium sp. ZW T5_56 TaxID=3378081 RepID=UPI00385449C2